ncbi:MAG: hypothetical protein PVG22_04720 [Chromatiales bacterium]|jgi:hypothetical protein
MDKKQHRNWPRLLLQAARKSAAGFLQMLPVMLGTLLLTSLIVPFVPRLFDAGLLGLNPFMDVLTGATAGSLAAGQPVVSYLMGGELGKLGMHPIGVTALIVSWVTVGLTNLPVEASMLGRRFALYRNLFSYLSALLIALITGGLLHALA